MREYFPVPVSSARDIANAFGKQIVVIVAVDRVHGQVHTTTYGKEAFDKIAAAELGQVLAEAAGGFTPAAHCFEDFRQPALHAELVDELLAAATETVNSVARLRSAIANPQERSCAMKMPKYLLRVAGSYFVVPHNSGVAALINLMSDAMPVHPDLHGGEIELLYCDEEDAFMLPALQQVSVTRIPPGIKWTRKTKSGTVEILKPVAVEGRKPAPKSKAKRIGGREPLQLEFGR